MSNIPLNQLQAAHPGGSSELMVRTFPRIKGGVCEYCGVIDKNLPGNHQYKLCMHYHGRDLRCSFCKDNADHDDVVRMSDMKVFEDPYLPGQMVLLCGSLECTKKFRVKYHLDG